MRAFYINLDRRSDRRQQVEAELSRVGLHAVRVPAVDGRLWDGTGWRRWCARTTEKVWRGGAGCWFSHQLALQTALETGAFPCLIVEDDVVFTAPLPTELTHPMTLLGGSYVPGKGWYHLHAAIYRDADAALTFLRALQQRKTTTDGTSTWLQRNRPDFITVIPDAARQRPSESDIQIEHAGSPE